MSKMVKIGVANQGNRMIALDDMLDWEPNKISYMGTAVFFQIEDVFYSIDRMDFERFFKLETTGRYIFNK